MTLLASVLELSRKGYRGGGRFAPPPTGRGSTIAQIWGGAADATPVQEFSGLHAERWEIEGGF